MTEQTANLLADTWERLLVAVRDSAAEAGPDEVKALAEAYELLTRHHSPRPTIM